MAVSVFKIDAGPPRAWVGSTPMHSRHTRFPARLSHDAPFVIQQKHPAFLLLAAMLVVGAPAAAQETAAVAVAAVDTLRPPITPGRAFFRSLVLPGSSQNILRRHKVGAGIILVEAMSIAMIRESGADVREARRQSGDSLIISYVDASGNRLTTPAIERRRFADEEVNARRSHVEDWVALLVANHLFAAADAFVAASLWDVDARVTVGGDRNRFLFGARIGW